ncbi:DUF4190 domain-containing protein [Branchiibius sp. NY16-3462-2]|uniref:DUF4190 domain-containing protein n=1 Tax=Branchiibius sp. NY16-3462-2 TaxID=1807500 RepID=UPI000799A7DD|nr:DUF4190 domain-containing protein [Branchiibius sp. NY16-3462-2]KYH43689.1 hypothetical protein AZH51_02460 [Branchiibius sp. NY16-3462-2]
MSSPTGPSDPKDPWAYDPSATQAVPATPPTAPTPTAPPSPYPNSSYPNAAYPNPWDQYQQPPQYGQYGQYGQYAGQYGPAYNPYPVGGPYQPGVVATTNGKATASLICAIASVFCFGPFLSVPAIILGFLARREIERTGNQQAGSGQALAGIIIGIIVTVLSVLVVVGMIALFSTGNLDSNYGDTGTF